MPGLFITSRFNRIHMNWYVVNDIEKVDSPALIVYPERVKENIRKVIEMAGDVALLRPHVKTNKIAEVCRLMMDAGINKFKCATIAEAEMLAMIGATRCFDRTPAGGTKNLQIVTVDQNISQHTFYLYHRQYRHCKRDL
jgi:D-serine deaminase-like pyridoxal phosphate-dependent protein